MRHEKAAGLLSLGRTLAGSAEGLTLAEMAACAGVDRRTAERMRDALRVLFPQMQEVADGGGKRFRIPGGLDGFMQAPSADELAELHAAAGAVDAAGGAARAALLRSLAGKIESSLRPAARSRMAPDLEALMMAEGHAMQAGPRPMADASLLATVRAALKASAALRFGYGGAGRERVASPWGLLYGRSYYLVGPEWGKERPVLWRLDRMSAPQLSGPAALPPAGWTIGEYAARSFGVFQERRQRVVLRFSPAAAEDAGRFLFHPSQVVEAQADGSLLVRFTAGGMMEMARHLFGWGVEVEVLAPEALRVVLCEALAVGVAHHAGSPGPNRNRPITASADAFAYR